MQKLQLYEVVLSIVTSLVLLLLTIVFATKRPLKKHNIAFAFLFTCGLCHACSYFIMWHQDEDSPCKFSSLTYYTFFLMRLAVMAINYIRIDPMIGKGLPYPAWLRWLCIPTVLATFVCPTVLRLSAGTDINTCSSKFFYQLVFTRIVPSFVFVGLFLAPLSRYNDPVLRGVMLKQGCFFIFDVCIECAFIVTTRDKSIDGKFVQIDAWSMILQQIFLVFMFSDAKLFYCPCIDFADEGIQIESCEEYDRSIVRSVSQGKSLHKSLLDIYRPEINWSWSSVGVQSSKNYTEVSMRSDLDRY